MAQDKKIQKLELGLDKKLENQLSPPGNKKIYDKMNSK